MTGRAGWTMRVQLILLTFVFACAAGGQTQREMTRQACDAYKRAESSRQELVTRIRAEHRGDRVFLNKFEVLEKAWLAYRDAYLDARWPVEDKQAEYGSAWPMCHCLEAESVVNQHAAELTEHWLSPHDDGDICAGSDQ